MAESIPSPSKEAPPVPRRVLAVMAHPDDPEFFAGGTLASWAARGAEVYVLILTDGSKGSDDPAMTPDALAAIRQQEQRAACAAEGVEDVFFLGYTDGALVPTSPQVQRDVVRVIRQLRPDAILTLDPSLVFTDDGRITHSDHRAAGQIAVDVAKIAAGNRFYFPELLAQGLEPHQVREIYITSPTSQPNFEVDITDCLDKKIAALGAHRSQIKDMDRLEKRFRSASIRAADGTERWVEKLRRFVLV
jgi:LmbE family N-acetylglucosaminyl deacetylase